MKGDTFKEYNHKEMLKKAELKAIAEAEERQKEKQRTIMATIAVPAPPISSSSSPPMPSSAETKDDSSSSAASKTTASERNPNWREELAEDRRIRNERILEANLYATRESASMSIDDAEDMEAMRQEGI